MAAEERYCLRWVEVDLYYLSTDNVRLSLIAAGDFAVLVWLQESWLAVSTGLSFTLALSDVASIQSFCFVIYLSGFHSNLIVLVPIPNHLTYIHS